MLKDQPADNTNDDVVFQLSTAELLDLYRKRKDRADLIWGQLMMRATLYERTCQENNKLVHLLRECIPYVDPTDETDLQARVIDALEEYKESEQE